MVLLRALQTFCCPGDASGTPQRYLLCRLLLLFHAEHGHNQLGSDNDVAYVYLVNTKRPCRPKSAAATTNSP
jgi:hypothetical protein